MSVKAYLLDTHVLLWILGDGDKIPSETKKILNEHSGRIYLSQISYWEICLKISKGTLDLGIDWSGKITEMVMINNFQWLKLGIDHMNQLATIPFPKDHRDPFDRMLISQALVENFTLVTGDKKIRQYEVDVL